MRKFESFFDIDTEVVFKDTKTLENKYVKMLSSRRGGFIRPLDNLTTYRAELAIKSTTSFEYRFVDMLVRRFNEFLLMHPENMQSFINRMNRLKLTGKFYKKRKNGKYSQTRFSTKLLKVLRYNEALGGGSKGKDLARMINIRACAYCNSQYTFSYKYDSKKISKLQLDHFFSKSKYPYFSISLYNLIPSCSYCNQKKSSKGFYLTNHAHPYSESFSDKFQFSLTPESEKRLLLKYKIAEKDIEVKLEHSGDKKVDAHNEIFDIEGIYNNHKNVVRSILKAGKAYPKLKIAEILQMKDEDGNKLFDTEEDFKRVFLNLPLKENEINTDPLSKLKQDFARKAGLL